MRAIVMWSGGKDCMLALERVLAQGADVVALATTVSREHQRVTMHGVRREVVREQARLLGLPLAEIEMSSLISCPDHRELTLAALTRARDEERVTHVVCGDLFLEEIRAWREDVFRDVGGLVGVYPVWGEDTAALARAFARTHRALVTCVDGEKLDASFAGRAFDDAFLADLPAGVDPCGENGEFHTLVTDGPLFAAPLRAHAGERVTREARFHFADVLLERTAEPALVTRSGG